MKYLNYILKGFGFADFNDMAHSTFGFITLPIFNYSLFIAVAAQWINYLFGFNHEFLMAYVILLIFEWITGVSASLKLGQKHTSRKVGRMLLKIGVYLVPIYILNTFAKKTDFPIAFGYELNPFVWLYWVYMLGVIWQLVVSLLENLKVLEFKFADTLLKAINKRFYQHLGIEEDKPK
jgi:hypothetical protein